MKRLPVAAGHVSSTGRYHTGHELYVVHSGGRVVDHRTGETVGTFDRNAARAYADQLDAARTNAGAAAPDRRSDGARARQTSQRDGDTSMAEQTTVTRLDGETPPTYETNDPIAAGALPRETSPAKKKPETAGAKRAREASAAFGRAHGLPVIEKGDSIPERIAAAAAESKKSASAPKSAQKGSTNVAKTNGKTTAKPKTAGASPEIKRARIVRVNGENIAGAVKRIADEHAAEHAAAKTKTAAPAEKPTTAAAAPKLPAKVATVVETMKSKDETRYAVKVWKLLTKKRTSPPAKYGLTSERAAVIFAKVEAAV